MVLRGYYDLSEPLAPRHVLVRGTRLAEGKRPVHDRLQPSAEDVFEDFVQLIHGSHVGAEDGKLTRIDETQVNPDLRPGGGAASHQSSAGFERAHALVPSSRTDVLHHYV